MPIAINEFIYHIKQRIAPRRRTSVDETNQEDIRELERTRTELALEREKQQLQLLIHRRFIL